MKYIGIAASKLHTLFIMADTKEKTNKLLTPSRIIFYAFAILVFYFALHHIGKLKDIQRLLLEMNPAWLLIAVLTQAGTYVFNALILKSFLKGEKLNVFKLSKISVVIMFVNQILPTGGLSGNGYIFNQLIKMKVPKSNALTALVLESICYYITMILLLAVFYGLYFYQFTPVNPVFTSTAITGFVFFIALGAVVLTLSNQAAISYVLQKLRRFKRIKSYIEKAGMSELYQQKEGTWNMFINHKNGIGMAVLLQFGILFLDMLTILAILKGFHISMPFPLIALGLILSLVVGSLPISPGSLIVYESAMTYFFTVLGLPVNEALIVTLLFRFLTFWLPIPFGLVLYRSIQKSAD